MQNLFVKPDDELVIRISVGVNPEGVIYCDVDEESLRLSLERDGIDVSEYEFKNYSAIFKKPSFGDVMNLYDTIFRMEDNYSSVNFSPISARFKKIVALIKQWDLTEDGSCIKPTDEEIKSLHPVVAAAIGIQLDAETGGLLS